MIPSGELIRDIANPLRKLQEIQRSIEKNVDVYFGIRSGLLSDDLIKAVISDIAQRFGSLTIKDIDNAFELYSVNKDSWKNITKRDIVEPVSQWWQKKESIRHDFIKFQHQLREEEEQELNRVKFLEDSLAMYRACRSVEDWKGDIFNAHAIAKDYLADKIPQEVKSDLWVQAQRDHKEAQAIAEQSLKDGIKLELTPAMIGISALRLFSEHIVKKAIELKIEI